jgi:hypothetical protein
VSEEVRGDARSCGPRGRSARVLVVPHSTGNDIHVGLRVGQVQVGLHLEADGRAACGCEPLGDHLITH